MAKRPLSAAQIAQRQAASRQAALKRELQGPTPAQQRQFELVRQVRQASTQRSRFNTLLAEGVPAAIARQLSQSSIQTPLVQVVRQDYNEQRKAKERARWFRRQEASQRLADAASLADRRTLETRAIRDSRPGDYVESRINRESAVEKYLLTAGVPRQWLRMEEFNYITSVEWSNKALQYWLQEFRALRRSGLALPDVRERLLARSAPFDRQGDPRERMAINNALNLIWEMYDPSERGRNVHRPRTERQKEQRRRSDQRRRARNRELKSFLPPLTSRES